MHNKIDALPIDAALPPSLSDNPVVPISAKTGEGINGLLEALSQAVISASGQVSAQSVSHGVHCHRVDVRFGSDTHGSTGPTLNRE